MRALIPGSYDPITLGHINVIERAASVFEEVFVAVMNNDSAKYDATLKSKNAAFTIQEREEMARLSLSHLKNVRVLSYTGRLIDLCDELSAYAIVRGIRDAKDFEYEQKHASWNMAHNPKIQVFYMPADARFDIISSTEARDMISRGEFSALGDMLPSVAVDFLEKKV